MNGVYPERVATVSWALGSFLAAIAGILIAPQLTLNHLLLTLLVINGYAAAMLGRLKNLPLTFIGALVIGLGQAYIIGYGSSVHIGSFRLISTAPIVPTVFLLAMTRSAPRARSSTRGSAIGTRRENACRWKRLTLRLAPMRRSGRVRASARSGATVGSYINAATVAGGSGQAAVNPVMQGLSVFGLGPRVGEVAGFAVGNGDMYVATLFRGLAPPPPEPASGWFRVRPLERPDRGRTERSSR